MPTGAPVFGNTPGTAVLPAAVRYTPIAWKLTSGGRSFPRLSDPALWIGQVEGAFRGTGITSQQTMADAVSASLDRDTAILVHDFVVAPDPTEPYNKLKKT